MPVIQIQIQFQIRLQFPESLLYSRVLYFLLYIASATINLWQEPVLPPRAELELCWCHLVLLRVHDVSALVRI
jgi:hypothetical protein